RGLLLRVLVIRFSVMAGHSASKTRVNALSSRPSTSLILFGEKGVDARDKRGHDTPTSSHPALPSPRARHGRRVRRHDGLADRPEREPRELEMRPAERDADDGEEQREREQEMAEREPPARQHE